MKVYVASSWRNTRYPEVIAELRAHGHEVLDWRCPADGKAFTSWPRHPDTPTDLAACTTEQALAVLQHPVAEQAFLRDFVLMKQADAIVGLQPFGRSASLELGWGVGNGRHTALLMAPGEPELMTKLVDVLCPDLTALLCWLAIWEERGIARRHPHGI